MIIDRFTSPVVCPAISQFFNKDGLVTGLPPYIPRQPAAVILRSHYLAVGSGGAYGKEVAPMALVHVVCLDKDIARLAYRSHDIVGCNRSVARYVLYLVVCLIQCRAYKVGHSGIYNGKTLGVPCFI